MSGWVLSTEIKMMWSEFSQLWFHWRKWLLFRWNWITTICCKTLYRVHNISSRDVLHQNFESYKPEVQELICVADRLGSLMQYETPGFLPNKRIHRGILKWSENGARIVQLWCTFEMNHLLCLLKISMGYEQKWVDSFVLNSERRMLLALAPVLLLWCRCRM